MSEGKHESIIYGTHFPDKLFIGCLPKKATAEQLCKSFSQFGKVIEAKVVLDKEGNSKRFGFVTFSSVTDAKTALENECVYILGKKANVGPAVRKEEKDYVPTSPVRFITSSAVTIDNKNFKTRSLRTTYRYALWSSNNSPSSNIHRNDDDIISRKSSSVPVTSRSNATTSLPPVQNESIPTTEHQQILSSEQQILSSEQQPMSSEQQPMSSEQQPMSSEQQPMSSEQQFIPSSEQQFIPSSKHNYTVDADKRRDLIPLSAEETLSSTPFCMKGYDQKEIQAVNFDNHKIVNHEILHLNSTYIGTKPFFYNSPIQYDNSLILQNNSPVQYSNTSYSMPLNYGYIPYPNYSPIIEPMIPFNQYQLITNYQI